MTTRPLGSMAWKLRPPSCATCFRNLYFWCSCSFVIVRRSTPRERCRAGTALYYYLVGFARVGSAPLADVTSKYYRSPDIIKCVHEASHEGGVAGGHAPRPTPLPAPEPLLRRLDRLRLVAGVLPRLRLGGLRARSRGPAERHGLGDPRPRRDAGRAGLPYPRRGPGARPPSDSRPLPPDRGSTGRLSRDSRPIGRVGRTVPSKAMRAGDFASSPKPACSPTIRPGKTRSRSFSVARTCGSWSSPSFATTWSPCPWPVYAVMGRDSSSTISTSFRPCSSLGRARDSWSGCVG